MMHHYHTYYVGAKCAFCCLPCRHERFVCMASHKLHAVKGTFKNTHELSNECASIAVHICARVGAKLGPLGCLFAFLSFIGTLGLFVCFFIFQDTYRAVWATQWKPNARGGPSEHVVDWDHPMRKATFPIQPEWWCLWRSRLCKCVCGVCVRKSNAKLNKKT